MNTYDLFSETLSILFRSGEDVDILSPCLKMKGNYEFSCILLLKQSLDSCLFMM